MSTPLPVEPSRKDAATIHRTMPGCGLAAYLGVLLTIMTLGGTAMLMSGLTIVSSSQAARPTRLMYGGDVEPYLLTGLRTVGMLQPGQVPDAFHAEDWSGMSVCALTSTDVLRLGSEGAFTLPIAAVGSVKEVAGGVQIDGPWQPTAVGLNGRPQTASTATVLCAFEPNDGGDRFVTMLSAATRSSKTQ